MEKFIEWVEKNGWGIFNGCMKGDEEEEFTFTGRGNTIIDFVLEKEEVRGEIEEMKIGDRIDSDYHPVEVKVKGSGRERQIKKGKEKKEWRGVWNEEGRKEFVQRMGKCERRRNEDIEKQ